MASDPVPSRVSDFISNLAFMGKWHTLLSLLVISFRLSAQSFELEQFSTGFTGPVDIENCGDGRLFIVQKSGYIYVCDSAGNKNATPFLDIHTKVKTSSERGLLGLAFAPDYFISGYFFIYYSPLGTDSNVIARYRVDPSNPDLADVNSEQFVLKIPHPDYDNHDGGCLRFGTDGYLYAGTGDGGSAWDPDNNGQNRMSFLGKILRLDVSVDSGYAVPPDNPFVGNATFAPEVWALGMRNPWRFSFDRLTHDLWIGDVGQGTWEEVDLITAPDTGGQNYGWDCYEGLAANETVHCDSAGDLTWPIHVYQHSGGDCSITGGFVYRGAQFKNFYGKYIFVDYCSGKFRIMEKDNNGNWNATQVLDGSNYNFTSFGEDRYGELYVTGYGSSDGKIYHIVDSLCAPVAQILIDNGNGNLFIDSIVCSPFTLQTPYGTGLTYQWYANGEEISGATSNVFQPAGSDSMNYTVLVTNSNGCTTLSSPVLDASSLEAAVISGLDSFYCIDQASDTINAVPSGGTFSGDGISGNVFDPATAGAGTHTISYSYTNSFQCEVTTTIGVTVDLCTAVNETELSRAVSLFPNPSGGMVTIVSKDLSEQRAQIIVRNLAGKEVFKTTNRYLTNQTNSVSFDFSFLPDGIYTLEVQLESRPEMLKMVIHH